jgi:hypothetical protein
VSGNLFFFEPGRVPKNPETALVKAVGTEIHRGPQEKENYNMILTLSNQDLRKKIKSAIKSYSTTTSVRPQSTAARLVAGDETTWDEASVWCRIEIEGPP